MRTWRRRVGFCGDQVSLRGWLLDEMKGES